MSVRKYSLDEILRLLVRRRWLVLIPFALGAAAAPLLARYAPERFRSEALILVIPQRVPDSYVKPTVSESVEDRLPSITDQILSRSRLERIIQEMGLYTAERSRQVMEDVVQSMRNDITTSTVGTRDINSFRVSYVSGNGETARKVTERLASLYIEQNLQDRESQAENTSQFLETQLQEAKQRLLEQEKRLEDYRRSHAGQLPTQLQGNLQAIQNANLQLQALNEATNRAQERRLLIERQIADAQQTVLPPPAPLPITTTAAPESSTAAQQLALARSRLAALLQRFTPDHPEVVNMERTISELIVRMEGEAPLSAALGIQPAPPPANSAEAAQQKRIQDLQASLVPIDFQLDANRTEQARLRQTISQYQANVDVLPTRESELVELTRDYSTMQTAYENLLTKRQDSAIAANLERRQIGEQFKLLDVASLPAAPYNQVQRLGVMASGAIAGLLVGLLLVGWLERRDSSFRAEEEIVKALNLPVLALIPTMNSDGERQAAARRRWAIDAGGTVVCLTVAAVLVFWRMNS